MGRGTGGGFGQPMGGGFGQGQPSAGGGFGQPAAAGSFGAPLQQGAAPPGGVHPTDLSFLSLPDFDSKPYGNILLFAPYDRPEAPKTQAEAQDMSPLSAPLPRRRFMQSLLYSAPPPDADAAIKQQPASLASSALSPAVLKSILSPAVRLGVSSGSAEPTQQAAESDDGADSILAVNTTASRELLPQLNTSALAGSVSATVAPMSAGSATNAMAPTCSNEEYFTVPSLEELEQLPEEKLRRFEHLRVGRCDGKCEVEFCGRLNLIRADIADLVVLGRDGDVTVFPKGELSAKINDRLKVKTLVTVYDVTNVSTEDLIKACHEQQARFLSYQDSVWRYVVNDDQPLSSKAVALPAASASTEMDDEKLSIDLDDRDEENVSRALVARAGSSGRDEAHLVVPPRAAPRLPPPAPSKALVERTTVQETFEFDLPYSLPDVSTTKREVRLGKVSLHRQQHLPVEPPVYLVNKKESDIHACYVVEANSAKTPGQISLLRGLTRSFRVCWSPAGMVVAPNFSAVHDGLEPSSDVPEVAGARVEQTNVFPWHKPTSKYLTSTTASVLRLLLQFVTVGDSPRLEVHAGKDGGAPRRRPCGFVSVGLQRKTSHNTLSEEKLRELVSALQSTPHPSTLSRTEAQSVKQSKSVVALLNALYGLPEGDEPMPNALEEARYLRQLRRRLLVGWLSDELNQLWSAPGQQASPAETIVQALLCHKLRDAGEAAKAADSSDIARVVSVCGEGNQFGAFVEMAKTHFSDGNEVRDRVVSILSGRAEPFVTEPEYDLEANASGEMRVTPRDRAATWKQLLGIFTFYGCTPDTPVEEIVSELLERLQSPSARKTNPLPPYAERVRGAPLEHKRGVDLVRRGNTFQDAAVLLLEGFAAGTAPPASCLHPHASSYCASDYLTPLLIVAAIRAVQLPRDRVFKDAETSVLIGMTAQLECNDATWFWGLLPLYMIENDVDRMDAVYDFCRRNALRASRMVPTSEGYGEYQRLLEMLHVDRDALQPAAPMPEHVNEAIENKPSMQTHVALQQALQKLTVCVL